MWRLKNTYLLTQNLGTITSYFPEFSTVFQDQGLILWLSRSDMLHLKSKDFPQSVRTLPTSVKQSQWQMKDKPRSRSGWLQRRSSLPSEQSASPSQRQVTWIHSEFSQRKRLLTEHDDCDVLADVPSHIYTHTDLSGCQEVEVKNCTSQFVEPHNFAQPHNTTLLHEYYLTTTEILKYTPTQRLPTHLPHGLEC